MIIPYATGDNTDVFGNVAAPTVVNPARIIYLYLIEKKQDVRELQESILYVAEYMCKRHFKVVVEFVMAYNETEVSLTNEEAEKAIMRLGGGRIR